MFSCDQNIYPCLQNDVKVDEYLQVSKGQMCIECSTLLIHLMFVNATLGSVHVNYIDHVSSDDV